MPTVLGITMSHHSSACVLKDGELVAAVAEERLDRVKFSAAFPQRSIRWVLEASGVRPQEIDVVAFGTKSEIFDSNRAQEREYRLLTRLVEVAARLLPLSFIGAALWRVLYVNLVGWWRKHCMLRDWGGFFDQLGIGRDKIVYYEHQPCHAATAHYLKPWSGRTLVFTLDGQGDGLSATISVGEGSELKQVVAISSIHSLGGLYAQTTRFLGMKPWQHEYKVMGLAPHADRKLAARSAAYFDRLYQVRGVRIINRCGAVSHGLVGKFNREIPNHRFDCVAFGVQQVIERVLVEWVTNAMRHFGIDRIACAGGVFQNVKANQKLAELPEVKDFFVFPAPGDESISIGAALLGHAEHCRSRGLEPRIAPLKTMYLGPSHDPRHDAFAAGLDPLRYRAEKQRDIHKVVADLLASGEIVARCSGPMEFGPRALGNRSLLADPSNLLVVQRLNALIKCRDFWMPFAPTVLAEAASDYLENPRNWPAPYMILTFDTKPETRHRIVAATHLGDHTTRPQILERDRNPGFYDLIQEFRERTGIGVVLNTSFNLHGEPIVDTPEDALHVLEHSGLTHLALGDWLITKL